MKLEGVVVPLATPLTREREIDVEALQRLVQRLVEAGVAGLFPLGSTGEFASLTDEQRRVVLEATVEAANGAAPVIAGATETGTDRVAAACRLAEETGADAVAIAPPFYFRLQSDDVVRAFYLDVARQTELPIIIYNNPSLTKIDITPSVVFDLARNEAFAGVKDSSGDFVSFMKLVRRFHDDPDFSVLLGDERIADAGVIMGANGFVPSIGNLVPEWTVELYNEASSRDLRQARETQEKILALTELYWVSLFPVGGLKYAMSLLGFCEEWMARPALELSDEEKRKIREIVEKSGLIG